MHSRTEERKTQVQPLILTLNSRSGPTGGEGVIDPTIWSKLLDLYFLAPKYHMEHASRKLCQALGQCPQCRSAGRAYVVHYNRYDSDHANSVKRYKLLALISLFTWLVGALFTCLMTDVLKMIDVVTVALEITKQQTKQRLKS